MGYNCDNFSRRLSFPCKLSLFNYFASGRLHLDIYNSKFVALSINPVREEGSLWELNQAQISLRRDICSDTISQVVICGIIASPTHKYMGVCMH